MVKDSFFKAYLPLGSASTSSKCTYLYFLRMQKKAYRRANGGSAAPTIQDDVRPRLVQREREELRVLAQRLRRQAMGKGTS